MNFKNIFQKFILSSFLLTLILTFNIKVFGDDDKVYKCTIVGDYKNPLTGKVEDSGGESAFATGQGMVNGTVKSKGKLIVKNSKYYLDFELSLAEFSSKHSFFYADDGSKAPCTLIGHGKDDNGKTNKYRATLKNESTVLRCTMYVDPMGRSVIYFISAGDLKEIGGAKSDKNKGKEPKDSKNVNQKVTNQKIPNPLNNAQSITPKNTPPMGANPQSTVPSDGNNMATDSVNNESGTQNPSNTMSPDMSNVPPFGMDNQQMIDYNSYMQNMMYLANLYRTYMQTQNPYGMQGGGQQNQYMPNYPSNPYIQGQTLPDPELMNGNPMIGQISSIYNQNYPNQNQINPMEQNPDLKATDSAFEYNAYNSQNAENAQGLILSTEKEAEEKIQQGLNKANIHINTQFFKDLLPTIIIFAIFFCITILLGIFRKKRMDNQKNVKKDIQTL